MYTTDILDSKKHSVPKPFAPAVVFLRPLYVCARNNMVAVSNDGNNTVYVLDCHGNLQYTHGTPGKSGCGEDTLHAPWGVALDASDNLYIADKYNHRVCILSNKGNYLGVVDLKKDQLSCPQAVTLDFEGHLLIACEDPQFIVTYDVDIN